MAEIIWSVPALADLDAIADDIAIDNAPAAAAALVKWVLPQVERLIEHPDSGSRPQELQRSRYRQIVEPPCRVFYRVDGSASCWCTSCGGSARFAGTVFHAKKSGQQNHGTATRRARPVLGAACTAPTRRL